LERLAADAPAALPSAVVVGDPCYDRLLASLPRRRRYRAALGVDDDRPVLLVTSTWGPDGLLGTCPEVVEELVAEWPQARIVLVAHPNVWAWHGAFQVRAWF